MADDRDDKEARQPDRGLGDTIKRATTAIGIHPCGGCRRRAEMLNRLVPYKQESPKENKPTGGASEPKTTS